MKQKINLNLPNTITLIRICMIPLIMLVLLLPIPEKRRLEITIPANWKLNLQM